MSVTRAAIYLRISQDATGEQAGVSRQREDCLALVDSLGWVIHDVYVDNDISASSGAARPSYKRMLAAIGDGLVDAVVAWHPDRLYRKLRDLEELITACEAHNVTMRTVRAGEIDLSTPTGRMLARILSATAQAEGEVKADRWKRSWRQGREAGQVARTGTRLFGYTRGGDVIPDEREVALMMVQHLLDGGSLNSLTWRLSELGSLGTRGNAWTAASIRRFVCNPRIAGYSTLNGEIVAEGEWEPLVDRESWESVTAILKARTSTRTPRVSLLNGITFCGVCGYRMITGSAGAGIRTYRCPRRPNMPGCGRLSRRAEPVEEFVEGYARERLADPAVLKQIAEDRARPGSGAEVAELELRIRELEGQLDEPGVPVAAILRAIERARDKQAELLARSSSDGPTVPLPRDAADWPTDLKQRRALIELVVERVEILAQPAGTRRSFDPRFVTLTPR